ncbi:acetylxylan esterase [Gleimia europaea]|uniref:Acetyl xylan esterase domain-containing protein n=3 Tax=Actinomycetaceae TaxID=2049 RepID=A0A9W5VWR5_9ACTO|nr:acetylxylan esterase [Gleimia europaea]EPD31297.1 hypothetical protein HMPREF9238_01065 [Gleimia europaea ACS-120-V-Col10b]
MALTDLTLTEMRSFQPDVHMPSDFTSFWENTLAQTRQKITQNGLVYSLTALDTPYQQVEFYDLEFPGFMGDPIRGWLSGPAGFMQQTDLPIMVQYHGYGGGRGIPGAYPHWPMAGYVHLSMDTRGQGGDFGGYAATSDPHPASSHARGFMSNGIESKEDYYFRRLVTDAVMAVDTALELPFVDKSRVFVTGASQGGYLSIAAGALHDCVRASMPDVAGFCYLMRGVDLTDDNPYRELARFFNTHPTRVDHYVKVLNYFDGVNFARIAQAPALFSLGMMDVTVPPSTTYAAYNVYNAPAEIEVYPYAGHDGGGLHHFLKQAEWVGQFL